MTPGAQQLLLDRLAYQLYLATLVGNPAPSVAMLGARMREPVTGDLVLEISTIYRDDRVGTRMGRLLRCVREPMYAPDEWYGEGGVEPDDPIPTEQVWYVLLPDGREFRWVNASFIAVSTSIPAYGERIESDGRMLEASAA